MLTCGHSVYIIYKLILERDKANFFSKKWDRLEIKLLGTKLVIKII